MSHELFTAPTFDAMEQHLAENKDKEFTLTGVDLTVLIFMTRHYTFAEISRNARESGIAEQETQSLITRLTDHGASK